MRAGRGAHQPHNPIPNQLTETPPTPMASLNRVLLIGNLTRDPELRHTPKGTAVAELGLAINRVLGPAEEGGDRREEVTFVDITLWGRQAEIAGQYLAKVVACLSKAAFNWTNGTTSRPAKN